MLVALIFRMELSGRKANILGIGFSYTFKTTL